MAFKLKTNLADANPEVAVLWHPTKNRDLSLGDVSSFSHKRVWWKCSKNHEWQATVGNVTRGHGCPICWRLTGATQRAISLRGSLNDRYPEIADQWHPTKNGDVLPDQVSSRCDKKVWWLCSCGDEWLARVAARSGGYGCPQCGLRKISIARRKRALKESLSVAETHPQLLTEWHPTKNAAISPTEISLGSHRPVWWVCKQGHEWTAILKSRTQGHGCPYCSPQSSRLEIRLLCELRALFSEVIWRKRFTPYECDIFLPGLSLGVEVDGFIWHKNRVQQDNHKNRMLAAHGVELFRVRGNGLTKVAEHDIFYSETENPLAIVHRLLQVLLPRVSNNENRKRIETHLATAHFANEKEYRAILATLPKPPHDRSLEAVCPHLLQEWHPRNLPLAPANFTAFSSKKVWWICLEGHEDYFASIAKRASGRGCPLCGRKMREVATVNAAIKRSGTVEQSLPHLLAEWHPALNLPLTPDQVSAGSSQKIWWCCAAGHEWRASVCSRKRRAACPQCSRKASGLKIRKAALRRGSLAEKHPQLAALWHPRKNGELQPTHVPSKSNMKVWWLCEKGHEAHQTISSRTDGVGCPECYKTSRVRLWG